jgi:hypothetical protein
VGDFHIGRKLGGFGHSIRQGLTGAGHSIRHSANAGLEGVKNTPGYIEQGAEKTGEEAPGQMEKGADAVGNGIASGIKASMGPERRSPVKKRDDKNVDNKTPTSDPVIIDQKKNDAGKQQILEDTKAWHSMLTTGGKPAMELYLKQANQRLIAMGMTEPAQRIEVIDEALQGVLLGKHAEPQTEGASSGASTLSQGRLPIDVSFINQIETVVNRQPSMSSVQMEQDAKIEAEQWKTLFSQFGNAAVERFVQSQDLHLKDSGIDSVKIRRDMIAENFLETLNSLALGETKSKQIVALSEDDLGTIDRLVT